MNAQDLKNSILQLAIQGKLVEQRPEEGTAEELYEQIQEEKVRLIAEGKIKKGKALPEITGEEIPFEIPDGWKWVRLGDISSILGDGIHGTPKYDDNGEYYFINGNNLTDGIILIKGNTKRVCADEFIKYKKDLNERTLLVSINGTIGNVAFYNNEKIMLGKSACYFNLMTEELKFYLYWVIKTKYFLDYAAYNATGSTIKNVSLATMKNFIVPLPPIEEQKRIIAKIEELSPLIEKYGAAQCNLEAFNKKFPEDMKKSILQYAIQGKLVEQRPEEGTADELFEQIQTEKSRLIAQGKIKKEKTLPEITADEIPFEIPESWKWVRLSEVVEFVGGGTPSKSNPNYWNGGIPWATVKDIKEVTLKSTIDNISEDGVKNSSTSIANPNDVLIVTRMAPGRSTVTQITTAINQDLKIAKTRIDIFPYFLSLYFTASMKRIESISTGTTVKGIQVLKLNELLFPLVPIEEQKRIVAKVEESLQYSGILKNNR